MIDYAGIKSKGEESSISSTSGSLLYYEMSEADLTFLKDQKSDGNAFLTQIPYPG